MGSNAIALGVNPPAQPQGPLQQAQGALSVQDMINQAQLQKQAMASNQITQQQQQLQLQQQQRAEQDQQTIRDMAPKFSGKDSNGNGTFDLDGLASAAQARGVNPQTINQLRMQNYQLQEAASKAGSEKLANELAHNKGAYEVIEGVKGVTDPTDRQNAYATGLNKLKLLGMDTSHLPPNAPTDDQLSAYETSLGMHGQILADAKTLAETNEKNATASEKEWQKFPNLGVMVNTKTGEQKSVTGAPIMPASMMEAKYVGIQQKKNEGQALTPDDVAFAKGYEKFKTLVPQMNFNLQNTGAAADANGNPSQIAQALANNQMKWSEAVSARTPQSVKNAIMAQVFKLNPNYDTSEFGLEQDAAKKARSGAWADTRLAYNTALDHSDLLLQAAKALNNGDIRTLNSLKNRFGTEFGGSGQITYDAIANAYNHEVNSVISKGHITDKEVETGHATLPDNANLGTIQSVVGAYKGLMASKRDELDKIVKAGAGNKASATIATGSSSEQSAHVIQLGGKNYRYKGSGPTNDLKSYDPVQ